MFLTVVFSVALVFNYWVFIFAESVVDPFKVSTGVETRENYLIRKIPYYPAVKYVNTQLPEGSKVLFVGESRGYYCKKGYIASSVFDKTPIVEWANMSDTPEELRKIFYKNQITHILFNKSEAKRLGDGFGVFYWTDKGGKIFREFQDKYLKEIFPHNNVSVYEVL